MFPALPLLLLACGADGSPDTAADSAGTTASCVYDGSDEGASPFALDGDVACGEVLFVDLCSSCHGGDGLGTDLGPDLSAHVPFHTDLEVVTVLLLGQGEMAAQGLSPQQHADLLGWLRETFGTYTGETHPK